MSSAIELTGSSLLVVEDETLLRKQVASHLERRGADVTSAGTLEAARNFLAHLDFDLVLLDVHLPDGKGTDLLQKKLIPENTGVVVMTADGGVKGAIEAMRLGALDYLVKPFEIQELPLVLARAQRARQSARLEEFHRSETAPSGADFYFGKALSALEERLQKILASDNRLRQQLPPVLIEGETGTGKTTIARCLHYQGPRAREPLVEMNCSAIAEPLAESELFGHERGAFTDARNARMGLFEAADGGTLFLDELPSLSPALQAKVLKTLEDHRIRRLGGTKEIPIDVRVIAASNLDLKVLVKEGTFREDLYHRLDLFRIPIPPVRERQEDIPHLAEILLKRLCRRHRLKKKSISAPGLARLQSYAWPGNVRELAHELERAVVFDEADSLDFAHLGSDSSASSLSPGASAEWLHPQFTFPPEGFQLEKAIQELIQRALEQSNQNVSAAARLLGVSRDFLRYRLSGQKSGTDPDGE
jgi:DNA-binding NtrC family response regulator